MKGINVRLSGISALLMHRFPLEPVTAIEKKSKEEQAELAAYRDPQGDLFVPGLNLQRALVAGGNYSKGKGRSTLAKIIAACVLVSPERLSLDREDYIIDSRPVVVPATKGRIVRHRPRFDEWGIACTLEYDETLLTEDQLRIVVDDTGRRVGLLDFCPERKGMFGRFVITEWLS